MACLPFTPRRHEVLTSFILLINWETELNHYIGIGIGLNAAQQCCEMKITHQRTLRAVGSREETTITVCITLVKPSACNSRKSVSGEHFNKRGSLPRLLLGTATCRSLLGKGASCPHFPMNDLSDAHTWTHLCAYARCSFIPFY